MYKIASLFILFFYSQLAFADLNCHFMLGGGHSEIRGIKETDIIDQLGLTGELSVTKNRDVGYRASTHCVEAGQKGKFQVGYGVHFSANGGISGGYTENLTYEEKSDLVDKLWYPRYTLSLAMQPMYKLSDNFNLMGKVGLGVFHTELDFQNENFKKSTANFYYGFDLNLLISRKWGISLTWDASKYKDITSNLFSLNATYQFNY